MKDHEINITIAEACGKPVCRHQPEKWERRGPDGDSELYCTECKEYLSNMRVADYCNDLNAIQNAVMALKTRKQKAQFMRMLTRWARRTNWLVCELPASAWCEVFLRIVGKYVACALLCLTLTGCRTTDNSEQQMEYSRVIPGFGNTLP